MILGGVGLVALGGLLLFATEGRPQNIGLNDLRFAALPAAAKAPASNPATRDKVAFGRLLFWDPDPQRSQGCRVRDMSSSAFRLRGESRPVDRRRRRGPRRVPPFPRREHHSVRQAEQPDDSQHGLQRDHRRRRVPSGHRADVLGLAGSRPRGAGARTHQNARGNARRRVHRSERHLERVRAQSRTPSIASSLPARSAARSRSPAIA